MLTVKEVSLTRETLEEIRKIDLEFYPNIGPIDWYLSRYKPWHSAFVAMDDEKIIGYFVAMTKNIDDEIQITLRLNTTMYPGTRILRHFYWPFNVSDGAVWCQRSIWRYRIH